MLWLHSFFRPSIDRDTVKLRMFDNGAALRISAALLAMVGSGGVALADNESQVAMMFRAPLMPVQATTAISPPALRFQRDGLLHAAWIEKIGVQGDVNAVRVSSDQSAIIPVRVNPSGGGSEAGWTEHAFPYNRIMVQQGQLPPVAIP